MANPTYSILTRKFLNFDCTFESSGEIWQILEQRTRGTALRSPVSDGSKSQGFPVQDRDTRWWSNWHAGPETSSALFWLRDIAEKRISSLTSLHLPCRKWVQAVSKEIWAVPQEILLLYTNKQVCDIETQGVPSVKRSLEREKYKSWKRSPATWRNTTTLSLWF